MGLAGRKTRQRIGEDPRNLAWSDDSSKFGVKYLQSLGWTSGTGLGVSGEGRSSNLKIHQKLDLMGIGANRRGPRGDESGWSGASEFEGLLARLNQVQDADNQDIDNEVTTDANNPVTDQPTRGTKSVVAKGSIEANDYSLDKSDMGTKRKRDVEQKQMKRRKKDTNEHEEIDLQEVKRRRKEEKKEQRKAEKAAKRMMSCDAIHEDQVGNGDKPGQDTKMVMTTPRVRAHRARNLASKRLAGASATGMNEILGIAPSAAVEQVMETSSNLPLQEHPVADEVVQTATSGLGSVIVKQATKINKTEPRQISSIGLGSSGSTQRNSDVQGDDGSNVLRSSGRSVAEYFAEKMRMKQSTSKGAVVLQST